MKHVAQTVVMAVALASALPISVATAQSAPAQSPRVDTEEGGVIVYIGTSGESKAKGIYMLRMDPQSGALTEPQLAAETKNPSFLAFGKDRRFLYAVSEVTDGATPGGGVASFSIDRKSGKLTPLNVQPSGGKGPCYVSVDKTGRNVLAANYSSGSVACLPIADDGSLQAPSATVQHAGGGPDAKRQTGPHAHFIDVDAGNRFAFACDLGLDKVLIYRLDAQKGTLQANDPAFAAVPPGSGPRHLAWHPDGTLAFVINELGSTVTAFRYDAQRGALSALQSVSTLPADFQGKNYCAEIVVHPSGKFLYGSNRGHNSIAVFAIDGESGKLTPLSRTSTQGDWPRNFALDPSGRFLIAANQKSNDLAVFAVDQKSGALMATGARVNVPAPVCVRFLTDQK